MNPLVNKFRKHWPLIRRIAGVMFLLLVAVLIVRQAQRVEWSQVDTAMRSYRWHTVLIAAGFTLLSYAVYSCFDLVSRHYVQSPLSRARTVAIAAVSYAFNQNFGALVGGIGFRFRLYSRFGLDSAQISRITSLSILTNWLGYSLIAGTAYAFGWVPVPQHWTLSATALRIGGGVLLVLALGYLFLALYRHQVAVGKVRIELPRNRAVLLQLLLSIVHWPLTAAVMWTLLRGEVDYPSVLGALLLASIAAAVSHIPAGLGVLEAVYFAVLGGRVPQGELLAALLAFRAFYHLLPLLIAGMGFVLMEAQAKRKGGVASSGSGASQHSEPWATQ